MVISQIRRRLRPAEKMGYHKYSRREKPRQEISRILKYIIFFVNFIFWACGIICVGLGIYLYSNDFRPVLEAADFILNPSILLIVAGCIIFCIAFLGCTGALREHVCLLKLFSLSLFFAYVCLVILAFVVFILFYSDAKTGISIQTVLQSAVKKYHNNKNMADLMDAVQLQLSCCGATALGYKDWNENSLYNCSVGNKDSPEHCAVPYTCCKRNANNEADVPNIRCGFGAQEKSITEIQNVINTDGCLHPLQKAFEGHAVIIGAVVGAIIIPVCLSVTFANILAKQIERQRYLLAKEARKEERRRRKERTKFRDPFTEIAVTNDENKTTVVIEQDETDEDNLRARKKLSNNNNKQKRKTDNIININKPGPSTDGQIEPQRDGNRPRVSQDKTAREMRKRRKARGVSAGAAVVVEPQNAAGGPVVLKKRRRHQRARSQDPLTVPQQNHCSSADAVRTGGDTSAPAAAAAATATTTTAKPAALEQGGKRMEN